MSTHAKLNVRNTKYHIAKVHYTLFELDSNYL
jgi:hypothetical protein